MMIGKRCTHLAGPGPFRAVRCRNARPVNLFRRGPHDFVDRPGDGYYGADAAEDVLEPGEFVGVVRPGEQQQPGVSALQVLYLERVAGAVGEAVDGTDMVAGPTDAVPMVTSAEGQGAVPVGVGDLREAPGDGGSPARRPGSMTLRSRNMCVSSVDAAWSPAASPHMASRRASAVTWRFALISNRAGPLHADGARFRRLSRCICVPYMVHSHAFGEWVRGGEC